MHLGRPPERETQPPPRSHDLGVPAPTHASSQQPSHARRRCTAQKARARIAAIEGCVVETEPLRVFWPAEEYHQK